MSASLPLIVRNLFAIRVPVRAWFYDRRVILVVEDEPGIVDFVERGLAKYGFEVSAAGDGATGLQRALEPDVELVLLDLNLPEISGSEVLRVLHAQRPALPVIVLTARSAVEDRIAGLDDGAVDYLVKPFALAELAARIRAHLRTTAHGSTIISTETLKIDLVSRQVRLDGELVRLSTTEYELLVYLAQNRPHVLSREEILRAVWGYSHDPGTNVLEVYVGYLRRKLSTPTRRAPIRTVRSVGYRFDESTS
ncbi:MAG: response regulator transcription factor [Solirubrobacteraceae bacterium]